MSNSSISGKIFGSSSVILGVHLKEYAHIIKKHISARRFNVCLVFLSLGLTEYYGENEVTIIPRKEPHQSPPAPVTTTATMSSEAETQQLPAAPAATLSAANTQHGSTGSGAGSGGPGSLT
ncbi:hypothetical protein STEG23_008413 [Scotinomys teguina]